MEKEAYASWEIENGYASDRFLKGEPSRAGEYQIKRRPSSQRDTRLCSWSQWAERGRRVLPNAEPAKVLRIKNYKLRLYSIEQTVSL